MENTMIAGTYKGYSSVFKARVALLALNEKENLSDLAARLNLNEALIRCWKEELLENSKKEGQEEHELFSVSFVDPRDIYAQDSETIREYKKEITIANGNRTFLAARLNLNEALIRCWKEELLENSKKEGQEEHELFSVSFVDPRDIYAQDSETIREYQKKITVANENRTLRPTQPKEKKGKLYRF